MLTRFLQNAGKSGLIRTVLVAIVMTIVAVKGGGPWHLVGAAVSVFLGVTLGNWMAARPETRHGWLRGLGLVLMACAILVGSVRKSIDLNEAYALAAVIAAVSFYMGAYVRFMSHSDVEIEQT